MAREILAVLMPEDAEGGQSPLQALIRTDEGGVELSDIQDRSALDRSAVCFEQGKAIIDPHSKEVIGYEMEVVNG
ncbi:MAG: hypothetical protein PVG91_10860 [Gammaproteobacteria bacterium]|jgi:hypothetical protein